jgi:hypothetical protein
MGLKVVQLDGLRLGHSSLNRYRKQKAYRLFTMVADPDLHYLSCWIRIHDAGSGSMISSNFTPNLEKVTFKTLKLFCITFFHFLLLRIILANY